MKKAKRLMVMGVDPGIQGAFVLFDGEKFGAYRMPAMGCGKTKVITFTSLSDFLGSIKKIYGGVHVFLERAVPMAMGSKGAFNYGRGFEALVIALESHEFPVTQVEPSKWTKEMHEGISSDLKAKAKSLVAVKRLYPRLVGELPQKPKGGLHDGVIDALLIAGYGLRKLGLEAVAIPDFY